MTPVDVHRSIETVWRMESARLVGGLARMVRDVELAEDLAQEALVAALEQWPVSGVPGNPGAWLMTVAKRRGIDRIRRAKLEARKHEAWSLDLETPQDSAEASLHARLDDPIGDDLLRLMFIACHPALSPEARAALTLRLLAGLSTAEIARAFLVPEATMAQRIVRAKRTLAEAQASFDIPRGAELTARLASVLEVIYLLFNEGYSASSGEDWVRLPLCEEALRLGRILAELVPQVREVHGLLALMELQASRLKARVSPTGDPILLMDQNRAAWDQLLIRRGLAALQKAQDLPGACGPYELQAAIAACHARARIPEETDWTRIASLYDALASVHPSPVVALNRAVAYGMALGPSEGLRLVEELDQEPALQEYHLLPCVRADLLLKLGRGGEAKAAFERAAALARRPKERDFLLARAAACIETPEE